MKFKSIVFLLLIFQFATAQETLDTLLKGLKFSDQHISLKQVEKGTDYFNYMSAGKNFFLKRPHYTCCDFIVYHIKTVDNLSYFGLVATYELEEEEFLDPIEHYYIFFDNKEQKCFILESNGLGLGGTSKVSNDELVVGGVGLSGQLGKVVKLDANLVPVSGVYVTYRV
ncbi:MAG: hypothetical protein V4581_14355 [Bacteroidota bacterium]